VKGRKIMFDDLDRLGYAIVGADFSSQLNRMPA
jgi:hypothetical protein